MVVEEESLLSREESFGPVVPILRAGDDDEAVAIANRSNLGLQAAVFTSTLEKAFWYADRIRSGTVVVNDSTDFWETFQPFGGAAGTGESGRAARAGRVSRGATARTARARVGRLAEVS